MLLRVTLSIPPSKDIPFFCIDTPYFFHLHFNTSFGLLSVRGKAKFPLLFPLSLRYVLRTTQCPWKNEKIYATGIIRFKPFFCLDISINYSPHTTLDQSNHFIPSWAAVLSVIFQLPPKKNVTQFGAETETSKLYRRSLAEVFTGTPCFWCMFKAQVKRTENWACADRGNERQ
jgi:hypothetical protein